MTGVYRFVGTESNVGAIKMRRFGQRFQMAEDMAKSAILGGAALIPEEDFKAIGFTDEDMKVWSDPMVNDDHVPSDKGEAARKMEYLVKRSKARMMFVELRHGMMDPLDRPLPDSGASASSQPAIVELAEEGEEE